MRPVELVFYNQSVLLALNEELHSLDKQTGKTNWTYEFDDFEISSFSSFAWL